MIPVQAIPLTSALESPWLRATVSKPAPVAITLVTMPENASALLLPQLTQEYVEKYWVVPSQTFDNVQDRPSGTYHQLWIGLHISADQLKKVREWERHSVRASRTKQVGVLGGTGVAAITILSGFVGVLARREKAKLKA